MKTRKLKANWSAEMAQDITNLHETSELWTKDWLKTIKAMKRKKGYLTKSSKLAIEEIERRLKRRTPSDTGIHERLDLVFDSSFITALNKIWETNQSNSGLEPGAYYEASPKNLTKQELKLYRISGEIKSQILREHYYRKINVRFNRELLNKFLFSAESAQMLVLGKPTDVNSINKKYGLCPETGTEDPSLGNGTCPITGYKSLFQEVLLFKDGKSQGVWFIESFFLGETAYQKIA